MDVVKIGLLGGTFDPIHNGHLYLAQAAYQALGLKTVLFIPAGDPPHKQDWSITPARHRLNMIDAALGDRANFAISRVDLDRPGPHYTVDTVALIRQAYHISKDHCYFIIGSDSLIDLPTWHQPQVLAKACRFAVLHRPNYRPDLISLEEKIPGLSARLTWIETTETPLSSTDIRRRIRQQESITDLMPRSVNAYIFHHNLYQ